MCKGMRKPSAAARMETMMTMGFIPVVATFAHIRHVIDEKMSKRKEVNPVRTQIKLASEQD